MPTQRQPHRIVRTASGRKLRSEDLHGKIRSLLENSPHLSNKQIAGQLGVSRTTAGKYAMEVRQANKARLDLRGTIKKFWNTDITNPAEIVELLKERYGITDISSHEVRRILGELQRDGIIRNQYADSAKLVFDRGKKREIKKDLDVTIHIQGPQAYWDEVLGNILKRESKMRYARSAPDEGEMLAQTIRRKAEKIAEKRRRRLLRDRDGS